MYYVCIENDQVTTILNYLPNAPEGVQIIQISDTDYKNISEGNMIFDVAMLAPRPMSSQEKDSANAWNMNKESFEFLKTTDWKVLRHIRQKALGLETSLTEEQYLELEQQRQAAADSIE